MDQKRLLVSAAVALMAFLGPSAFPQDDLQRVEDAIRDVEQQIERYRNQTAEDEGAVELRRRRILAEDRLEALREQKRYLEKYQRNGTAVDGYEFIHDSVAYLKAALPDGWTATDSGLEVFHKRIRGQIVSVEGCTTHKQQILIFSPEHPRDFQGDDHPFIYFGQEVIAVFALDEALRKRDDERIGWQVDLIERWAPPESHCKTLAVEGVVEGVSQYVSERRFPRYLVVLDDWILVE